MKKHGDYRVEILDTHGRLVTTKRRADVDKTRDALHVVYIFVVTPEGKLLLSRIPSDPTKKNLFPGKLSVTVATIVRAGETHLRAAKRALRHELRAMPADLTFLGETLENFAGLPKRLVATYMGTLNEMSIVPNTEHVEAIVPVSRKELEELFNKPGAIAPTLSLFWGRHAESFDEH